MFITQKQIAPDGTPLQTEFSAPERKDAKPINFYHTKRYKKAYGLQNFGIAKEGQTELSGIELENALTGEKKIIYWDHRLSESDK